MTGDPGSGPTVPATPHPGGAPVSRRCVEPGPKPVVRRLLPPLAAMVFLLLAGAALLLWQQMRRHVADESAARVAAVERELGVDLTNQAAGLAMTLQPIALDPGLQQALREPDGCLASAVRAAPP